MRTVYREMCLNYFRSIFPDEEKSGKGWIDSEDLKFEVEYLL